MMSLEVIPDRFAKAGKGIISSSHRDDLTAPPVDNHIRRMTRGIVLKEDTFATLRLVAGNDQRIPLVDAGSKRKAIAKDGKVTDQFLQIGNKRATDIYSNFLIQQISEERMEKQQIMETFGEPYIFLFGERARVMSFQGILANTLDFNWEAEWWHNYENYLRGTKCVENDARVFLSFDNTLIGGYIISTASNKVAEQRNFVNFQFQLFITSYSNFVEPGDPQAPGNRAVRNAIDDLFAPPLRPVLLSDLQTDLQAFQDGIVVGTGNLPGEPQIEQPDFPEFVDASLQFLSDVWNGAAEALKSTEDLLMRVRIPLGFEGALAFDQDADSHYIHAAEDDVIQFGTFDQNYDEYVGSTDHYGSSAIVSVIQAPTGEEELTRDNALVLKVDAQLAAQGFKIPTTSTNDVASFFVSESLGLLAVGASAAWSQALNKGIDSLTSTLESQDASLEEELTRQARSQNKAVLAKSPNPE